MLKIKRLMLCLAIVMSCSMFFALIGNAATNYSQSWTNGQGTVNYQNLSGGQYKVNWSNVGNFVAGKGYNPSGSRTMSWSGYASGAQYFGVYGWLTGPLVEYYIGRGGGSSKGSYSTSKGTYTLYTQSVTGPSIQGNTTFTQYNCSGSGSSGINLAEHFAGWRTLGQPVGSTNYCIVAVEGWGGSSGSADVTVN
ncbi:glycoside hydrolase family 11 protein [Ruminiclostridium cellobioparum]|jgi:endo-1,4-beta-xylanase|uniref:glycoside hydrolase family 11 protein n=1 Tax=Ruminiclostridium cellobioparum TaxID=29355 RepID=UPI0004845774|nr:glycoside hydrolase family 11 protein [Ruminiclostridium cellobioparum]